jgi:hypothetical protein
MKATTDGQDAEIIQRGQAGETFRAIAKVMGLKPDLVKKRYRTAYPIARVPADIEAEFRRVWASGLSKPKMGKMFGCNPTTIGNWRATLGLPERMTGRKNADPWTDEEYAIVIQCGYDRRLDAIAAMLPGRTATAVEAVRKMLRRAGRIALPVFRPRKERKRKPKARKPPPLTPAQRSENSRRASEIRWGAREEPAPMLDAPAVDLAPDEERVRYLRWPQVQAVGLAYGLELRTLADHQKLLRKLAELGKPPVFIRRTAAWT